MQWQELAQELYASSVQELEPDDCAPAEVNRLILALIGLDNMDDLPAPIDYSEVAAELIPDGEFGPALRACCHWLDEKVSFDPEG